MPADRSRSGGGELPPEILALPAEDPASRALLEAYAAELRVRMLAGYDPTRAAPPDPADFDPPAGVFLVAFLGRDPVGCAALRTIGEEVGEIRRMYVAPRARGRGVGRRLLGSVEAAARERGHRLVRLDTSEELHEAHALYESCGYLRIDPYNENEFAARWYEKSLE